MTAVDTIYQPLVALCGLTRFQHLDPATSC